ncbi:MAG: type II toxin-antitoxin system VapC family toxin [Verrucomicrobiota bacterium]
MIYLLDTNVVSDHMRGRPEKLFRRFEATPLHDMRLCSMVRAELLFGARRLTKPELLLEAISDYFRKITSLSFDDRCAAYHAELRAHLQSKGTPIGPHDMLIASIALAHNLILVTHNTREFARVPGLVLEDWQD